jgi:hypothetical protein
MDGKPKRALPARTEEDSPELHAAKKTRTVAESLSLRNNVLNQEDDFLNQEDDILNQDDEALSAHGSDNDESSAPPSLQPKETAPRSESSRSSSTSSPRDRSSSKEQSSDSTASNVTRTRTHLQAYRGRQSHKGQRLPRCVQRVQSFLRSRGPIGSKAEIRRMLYR